jgi:proteasome lid subunit RPN8/RPN11
MLEVLRRPTEVRITRPLFDQMVAHVAAAAPHEGCGMLAVREDGDADRATRFYPGTNIDASPTRYTMDPSEVLAAFRDMTAAGWRLGAIVHSHPATAPHPSPTDLREAYYPDSLLIIVSLADAVSVVRAWQLGLEANGTAVLVGEAPIVVDSNGMHESNPGDGPGDPVQIPPLRH